MEKRKLPKSIRKFIRKEKARIRREVLNIKEQKELINELHPKFLKIKSTPEKDYAKQKIQQVS